MANQNTANDDIQIEVSPQKVVSPVFSLRDVRQTKGTQIVLDNINLEIETGKITALIGPSGAGKTSLLRLLNRLDDPASGQIFYRSRPIEEYPVRELRLQVGFVFQTPVMFPGTVADNLRTALEITGKSVANSDDLIAETLRLAEIDGSLATRDGARLVDNFHIVEDQLRQIREDLPQRFYGELPKLTEGDFKGFPRIYAVAVALVAHTDSRLEAETLRRFLNAYQTITPLNIGELWATAITLRIVLVENLRRLASRIIISRQERDEADTLARELLELAEKQPDEVLPFFKKQINKRKNLGNTFIVQLTRQLRNKTRLSQTPLNLSKKRSNPKAKTSMKSFNRNIRGKPPRRLRSEILSRVCVCFRRSIGKSFLKASVLSSRFWKAIRRAFMSRRIFRPETAIATKSSELPNAQKQASWKLPPAR